MGQTIVTVGASRGIGEAVARHYVAASATVYSVSRSPSPHGRWIEADLATPAGIAAIAAALGDQPVDALLFTGGVWEQGAFTKHYDFLRTSYEENLNVLAVNLLAPIEVTRALAPNLVRATNPCGIYLGSLSGLDHTGSPEVANTASKFGLRGAIQALTKTYAAEQIRFTVINPGNVATPEVLEDIADGTFAVQRPIPIADIVRAIDFVMQLSPDTYVGDIDLFQTDQR